MQFWKDYIYDFIKKLAWACGDVTKECMSGIWKNTLKKFGHDYEGFAKEGKVAINSKAVVEMASNCNLGVNEDDIEELPEAVPEELTIEKLLEQEQEQELEQEQERIAEEEASEKEAAGKEKEENPLRKFTIKGLAEAFADLNKLLKVDSHIACRAHAVPLPCRAAKDLEYVFPF
jgi:hypothetical protein